MTTFLRMIVPAAVLAIAAPLSAQAGDPARASVQTLDDGLLAIMKGGKALGAAGRAARIAPVVDQTFDVPLITRLSVGADWLKVAPADQTALVAAMRRLTVAQYAANFDSYGGEAFTINPTVEMRAGDKVVRTTLAAPKGDAVPIDYRMRQSGSSWRIIDVYYKNGISQLATRRADFASIFAKGGAKALISHLNALSAKGGR
ncbi:ABC transporter substrate-binding protein [Sphingomonas sp. UYP23]